MSSKLFIVSTPIGNLKDITLRALETLKSVDIIACEDTRWTRKLLSYHKINSKHLITHHDKNEKKSAQGIIDLIKNHNKDIALVSDAGSPLISDPGFHLVRMCKKEEIPVIIIPGVSAHVMAIQLSSLGPNYTFLGFLTFRREARKNLLRNLKNGTYVTYVSPYKLIQTLEDIYEVLGPKVKISLSKELTKIHEYVYNDTVEKVISILKNNNIKGEYTLVFKVKKNN